MSLLTRSLPNGRTGTGTACYTTRGRSLSTVAAAGRPYGVILGLALCLALFILPLLAPGGATVAAFEAADVQSAMYQKKPFVRETYNFSPFDTVYLAVDFRNLRPGTYNLITDWKTPWGSLEHQSSHSFEITSQVPSYKLFSWLRLWKNGPFKRLVTGEEYKKNFYGMWEVSMYLNGDLVTQKHFEMQ